MTAAQQLKSSLARYDAKIAALGLAAIKRLRRLLPGALQLVYDNYNALVVAFAASERASTAIVSIALYPRWVTLFFLHGASLSDPRKLLVGSGKQVRSIVLADAKTLDQPEVRALIAQGAQREPLDPKQKTKLLIKAISRKQRPRRPR